MHDLSTKFQVSECNIVIFMHVPRYALDVPHHAVDTLATAGQNSLSLCHTLLFSWDLPDLKRYCLLEFLDCLWSSVNDVSQSCGPPHVTVDLLKL